MLNGNTSAIWRIAAHTTYQLSSSWSTVRSLTPNKKLRVFWKKVRRMDYQQKNDEIKRARGLCRKTGFQHSNNIWFIPSCEWIYLLKVNLKISQESLNNEMNHQRRHYQSFACHHKSFSEEKALVFVRHHWSLSEEKALPVFARHHWPFSEEKVPVFVRHHWSFSDEK